VHLPVLTFFVARLQDEALYTFEVVKKLDLVDQVVVLIIANELIEHNP